ncbi:MAG: hypothetical protein ACLFTY_01545 [Candidatus Aenigmatarchaeota archaeon]
MEEDLSKSRKDIGGEKTSRQEIRTWMDYIDNLRKAGYNDRGAFFVAFSGEPLRIEGDLNLFEEYGDTVAEIYDPSGVPEERELINEFFKGQPGNLVKLFKDADNVLFKEGGKVMELDVDNMNKDGLEDLATGIYEAARNSPVPSCESELEKNYGEKLAPDFTGEWHKASEEIDSKKLYL